MRTIRLAAWVPAGVLAFLLAGGSLRALGATHYWIGTDANWSSATAWSSSSGGDAGASVPDSGDTVIFDGGGTGNAVVDAAFGGSVGAVDIQAGYTGAITQNRDLNVATNFTLSVGAMWRFTADTAAALSVGSNMTVHGTIQCQRSSTSPSGEGAGRVFTVGGDLTVSGTGLVDAYAQGFTVNQGSGSGGTATQCGGGGHGGEGGGRGDWAFAGGTTYGSITAPTSLGSGGFHETSTGGGAIMFDVTGDALINGTMTADANHSSGLGGGGGSIVLRAASITGAGELLARGGNNTGGGNCWGPNGGSGGGGRIALVLDGTAYAGNPALKANGGSGKGQFGAAGTVYIQNPGQSVGEGKLIIDNANIVTRAVTLMPAGTDLDGFSEVVLTNRANLGIKDGVTLSFGTANLGVYGTNASIVTIRGTANVSFPKNMTVSGFTLNAETPFAVTSNLTIAADGMLTHTANHTGNNYLLHVTVPGDLTVDGHISADARGYRGGGA